MLKTAAAMLPLVTATVVNAVHINTDGAGQIALLPYYNVNNGFITNVTITNTTSLYKAVKVRFHESRDGADFRNTYRAYTSEDLTEGYVEIIEMGVTADGYAPD
jgi:hypothetical protein